MPLRGADAPVAAVAIEWLTHPVEGPELDNLQAATGEVSTAGQLPVLSQHPRALEPQ